MKPQELELIAKTITSLGENGEQAFTVYMLAYCVTWALHYLSVVISIIGSIWIINDTIRRGMDKE